MALLIFWIGCAIAVAYAAQNRGRSWNVWFFGSLLCPLLAFLLLLALGNSETGYARVDKWVGRKDTIDWLKVDWSGTTITVKPTAIEMSAEARASAIRNGNKEALLLLGIAAIVIVIGFFWVVTS